MKELAKQYDPSQVEDRIYQFWLDGGYFHTEADPDKKPYTIVMPPPNVTGQLHMGHALDNTMQDVLIRTKRMQGYAALWVPGTDHASIATEAKVVEAMRAEGLTKEMVGRDGFLERAWDWKTKFGNRIVSQLKKLGSSCDWDRERFTMDEGCSKAVRETFCELYDKGLIYKGSRIINWCPHCKTSISDAEVVFEEKEEQKCPTLDMESCLIDFEKTNFELDDTDTIPLQHSLFYKDALVFENLNSTCVSLKSRQSGRGVMMEFSGFPMLGIWSAANDGPYVALEPWTGCATAVQEDDVFEKKHGMRTLQPGEEAEYAYTVFEI